MKEQELGLYSFPPENRDAFLWMNRTRRELFQHIATGNATTSTASELVATVAPRFHAYTKGSDYEFPSSKTYETFEEMNRTGRELLKNPYIRAYMKNHKVGVEELLKIAAGNELVKNMEGLVAHKIGNTGDYLSALYPVETTEQPLLLSQETVKGLEKDDKKSVLLHLTTRNGVPYYIDNRLDPIIPMEVVDFMETHATLPGEKEQQAGLFLSSTDTKNNAYFHTEFRYSVVPMPLLYPINFSHFRYELDVSIHEARHAQQPLTLYGLLSEIDAIVAVEEVFSQPIDKVCQGAFYEKLPDIVHAQSLWNNAKEAQIGQLITIFRGMKSRVSPISLSLDHNIASNKRSNDEFLGITQIGNS